MIHLSDGDSGRWQSHIVFSFDTSKWLLISARSRLDSGMVDFLPLDFIPNLSSHLTFTMSSLLGTTLHQKHNQHHLPAPARLPFIKISSIGNVTSLEALGLIHVFR